MEDDIKWDKMDFSQKHILSNKNRQEHLNILKLSWVGLGLGGQRKQHIITCSQNKLSYE